MIYCPQCHTANRDGSRFCNECGADLRNAGRRCASCGAFNSDDRAECVNCGARLVATVDAEPPELPEEDAPTRELPAFAAPMPDAELPAAIEPDAGSAPAADAQEPEWLRALRANPETPAQEATAETAAEPLSEGELPEWLRALTQQAAPVVESLDEGVGAPIAAPEPPKEEPAPVDVLLMIPEPAAAENADAETPPAPLAEMQSEAPAVQPPPAEAAPVALEDAPEWLADTAQPPPASEAALPATGTEASGLQPGEAPEWLTNLGPMHAADIDASLSDVALDELPEWLRPATPAPEAAVAESAPPAEPETIEPEPSDLPAAEMPPWVKALKPGSLPTLSGESLETSGLLAGVHGALPVENALLAPHSRPEPAGTAAPAPITGFSELSTPQAAPRPVAAEPAAPSKKRSGCLRLWLFVIIAAVAAFPFLPLPFVSEVRGANINGHQSTLDFYQTINQLSALRPGSLVLLGIDYSAGARGELDPQARAAVLHLLQNKQHIVAASFVPDGGQLAQDALNSGSPAATSFNYPYAYGVTHVNAGYLSGGAAAMRSLAQNGLPVAGADFGGRLLANLQLSAGLKSAKAVDLVIVITDDGAQLKHWIEQVVRDGNPPLIAGVSAATEPLAVPYYDSGQLKGMLVGQRGAAEYEGYLGRPASASASLDAISYVLLVLVLAIAGALVVRLLSRPASA